MHELALAVHVLELDVERLGEVLAEVVRRAHLQRLAVLHDAFDGVGAQRAGEGLQLRLPALEHGHREPVARHALVDVEHLERLFLRLFLGGVDGVALLPEELRGAEEEAGPHLPAHDVGPLVDQDGQVAVALHPLGVGVADDRLRRGPDDEGLLELLAAAVGDDGELGRESLDVLRLLVEEGLGNEDGEVGVLVARLLEHAVEGRLDVLPERVAVRLDHHAAADRRVLGELAGLDTTSWYQRGKSSVRGVILLLMWA